MRALVLALALLVLSAPARAQVADPTAELIEALFSMIGAGVGEAARVEATVGEAPPRVASDPLPTGAVVLGGMTLTPPEPAFSDGFSVVFARLDAEPEAAAADYVAGIPDGWTASAQTYQAGGVDLCGPDGGRTVLFAPRRLGGTYVSLADESKPCPDDRRDVSRAPTDIGDGEIIDEPEPPPEAVEATVEPGDPMVADDFEPIALPMAFPPGAFADQTGDDFGYENDGLRGGYQRVEVKEGSSVASVAGIVAAAYAAEGWTRLGEDAALADALVSTWTRTEAAAFDHLPDVVTIATIRVQPTGEGTFEVLVTATR